MLVTDDTYQGGKTINKRRIKQELPPLIVVSFPLVTGADTVPISSTRIRQGQINRVGETYLKQSFFEASSVLPSTLRHLLQKPFGDIIKFESHELSEIDLQTVVTVGDITTKNFLDKKLYPKIAIIDFVVEREKRSLSYEDMGFPKSAMRYEVDNPPGTLTPGLFVILKRIISDNYENSVLVVTGEEDLSVLTVLVYVPLGFHIFYGQPHEGMVHITVNEEIKEKAKSILSEFTY